MAFPTKDAFTFDYTSQPDYPNWIPSVTKSNMNARSEEMRVALNVIVGLLNGGAKNIWADTIVGLTGNDVQTLLAALKTTVNNVVLGQIPDASLVYGKLAVGIQTAPMFPANLLIKLDGLTIGNFTLTMIPVQLGTVILA